MNAVFEFAKSLPSETICYGSPVILPKQIILHAGKLSMIYENGSLRTISIGELEIVRMIYAAVRGKAWLTAEPKITNEEFEIQEDSFQIKFTCHYRLAEIDFVATFLIKGDADSSVSFEMEGKALTTFEKCRIGFCLLHPVEECAGKSCIITHSNGEKENSVFPVNISPAQPFHDVRSMDWKVFEYQCTVDFAGDIFETEDHRNWTDASYKTYCTPLNLPYPVIIHKGDKIVQKITLKVVSISTQPSKKNPVNQIVLFPHQLKPLPKIGICKSTRPQKMSNNEISILKSIPFDHYRLDLYLFEDDWLLKAKIAIAEAKQLDYPVMFALFFGEKAEDQAAQFIDWVLASEAKIEEILLFHEFIQSTPDSLTGSVSPLFRSKFPGVKIGCGTNANFAQLNRNRPISDCVDILSYSIHPQEHAKDNQTLVENLKAQEYTIKSATQFACGKDIWISPVTIQRRFNGNLENFEHPVVQATIPPQVDARLMSLFGGGWSAISLKYLSEAGVNGCTYFETVGERGLFQGESTTRWPLEFFSAPGMIFPVFHVFKFILENKGFKVMSSQSSRPLYVDSIALTDGVKINLIVVNFTAQLQEFEILGVQGNWKVKSLDIESFALAVSNTEWFYRESEDVINIGIIQSISPFSISLFDGLLKL